MTSVQLTSSISSPLFGLRDAGLWEEVKDHESEEEFWSACSIQKMGEQQTDHQVR